MECKIEKEFKKFTSLRHYMDDLVCEHRLLTEQEEEIKEV